MEELSPTDIKLSYYERNKEKIRAYYQKYYELNRLIILEKIKYNPRRKEWFKLYNKLIKKKPNELNKVVDKIIVYFT
jgi:hypothetical protein